MATILYFSSHGSDRPTDATIAFHMAMGAIEAGHQPVIALAGEATYLMKDYVAEQIRGVGVPPLLELMQKAVEHGVPIAI